MNFWLVLSVVSSVCGIVGFILNVYVSKLTKTEIWRWYVIVIFLICSCGSAVYYGSELEWLNSVHRKATIILKDYNDFGPNHEFIQESLTFLEENKDKYPDAYQRAKKIYNDMKDSDYQFTSGPALEIRGIIKGIATLNGE